VTPRITTFTGGLVGTNGYLVEGPGGLVIIDAPAGISESLASDQHPAAVLLTHQHFDHVEDVAALAAQGVPVHAWSGYAPDLVLDEAARRWGMPVTIPPFEVDQILDGKTSLEVAGLTFTLLHVPGHSPDSVCFHLPDAGTLFGGDTLFAGSIGRTDLPGGDPDLFSREIRAQLLPLPGETTVHPGHGPATTIAREIASNPFLR
jgi:glyoxylase-like metal-dependent hydrolase (beta-lactamase superfamily II)